MQMPIFIKKFEKLFPEEHLPNEQNILLKTIKFPKNLMYLSDKLPRQNYQSMIESSPTDHDDQGAMSTQHRKKGSTGTNKSKFYGEIKLP